MGTKPYKPSVIIPFLALKIFKYENFLNDLFLRL